MLAACQSGIAWDFDGILSLACHLPFGKELLGLGTLIWGAQRGHGYAKELLLVAGRKEGREEDAM